MSFNDVWSIKSNASLINNYTMFFIYSIILFVIYNIVNIFIKRLEVGLITQTVLIVSAAEMEQ